jgi:hypothetical protein
VLPCLCAHEAGNTYITASGAAGNDFGTTIKYLRRTRNGAAGSGLGTTIKNLLQETAAGNRLATTIKYLRGAAGIGLGTTIKHIAQCLCVLKVIVLHFKKKQMSIT